MDNRYMLQFIVSQVREEGDGADENGMDIEVGRKKKDSLVINERKDSSL